MMSEAQPYEPHSKKTIADKLAPKGKPAYTIRDLTGIIERTLERIRQLDPNHPLLGKLDADAYTKNEGTNMTDDRQDIHTRDDVVSMKVYGLAAFNDRASDPRQALVDKLWRILGAIELAENFSLRIGVDEKVPAPYGAIFIQVRCWRRDVITGKWGFGWGGKATVSPFQTESEIVGMAFGLYKSYFEHEARETFKFEDRRIFGPHIDIRALHSVARKVDVRSAQHTTDKL